MRKLIPIIICLCALLGYSADAQSWLIPKPTTTYPNPQSIYYNTTNLFINSFYLGGSNGFSGYWIWNGIRLNGPQDLAVAVSNSVAPSNFVYKVDLDPVISNLHSTSHNPLPSAFSLKKDRVKIFSLAELLCKNFDTFFSKDGYQYKYGRV